MESKSKELLKLAGDKNRYQYILVFIFFYSWAGLNLLSYTLGFLETKETVSYYSPISQKNITSEKDDEFCSQNIEEYTVTETYNISWAIDLNIECDKTKISLIGTFLSLGLLLGSLLFSFFNDLIGERKTLIIGFIIFIIPYILSLFINNYYLFLCLDLLTMALSNICCFTQSTLISDFVSPELKSVFGSIMNAGLGVGGIVYVLLFYAFKAWKPVFIFCIVCGFSLIFLTFFLVSNSFSYYIKRKDSEGLIKSLKFIAKINGKLEQFDKEIKKEEFQNYFKTIRGEEKLSVKVETPKQNLLSPRNALFERNNLNNLELNKEENSEKLDKESVEKLSLNNKNEFYKKPSLINNLPQTEPQTPAIALNQTPNVNLNIIEEINTPNTISSSNKEQKSEEEEKVNILSLLKYKSVRKTFLLINLIWMCTSMLYTGSVIGLKRLKGSIYINSLLLFICETPAYFSTGFLMNLKVLGRKKTLIIMTAAFASMNILSYIFFKKDTVVIACYLATRFFVMSCFCVYYTFCLESYPKSINSLAYGINGAFNSLGGIIVPFIIEYIEDRLRFLIFGIMGFCCCGLIFFLNETIGKTVPDQIKEIEEKKNKGKVVEIPEIPMQDMGI